jgi:hypothetical protein
VRRALAAAAAVAAVASCATLWSEAGELLDILQSQGYRIGGITEVEVSYLQPCTLYTSRSFLADSRGGFLIAMGGNHILDLELELQGYGWTLRDTLPDDMPVIEVDSSHIATSSLMVLLARDMTHCALQDSVVVVWALLPVDHDH